MTETETKIRKTLRKIFSKGDTLLKWYSVFAVFLFLNLCGVGYAYYYKFYRNKNTSPNSTKETPLAQIIVLPSDTVYVDNIDDENSTDATDADEVEETRDVLPVSHIERARELTFSVKSAESNKSTASNSSSNDGNVSNTDNQTDVVDNDKSVASTNNNNKPSTPKSTMKSEEESHTYLISLGMFKVKENALSLIVELKQKGIEGEIISSNHFEKLPPSYILVLGGKELSSASAYQMCSEMKKKGIDCYVQDGGKYSWR